MKENFDGSSVKDLLRKLINRQAGRKKDIPAFPPLLNLLYPSRVAYYKRVLEDEEVEELERNFEKAVKHSDFHSNQETILSILVAPLIK